MEGIVYFEPKQYEEQMKNTDNEKSDIVERLKSDSAVLISCGRDFSDTLLDAANIIEDLRSALRSIGYDYVELSHEKVNWLYLDHMKTARAALIKSYPDSQEENQTPNLNDNF